MSKNIKLKDLLKESGITGFSGFGGVVSRQAFVPIVEEEWKDDIEEEFDANAFLEEVGNFNTFGQHIYRKGSLKDISEKLSKICKNAKTHALKETEDWFDKVTVNRHMKELANLSKGFDKTAREYTSLQERIEGLYEDMGTILSKYYEIKDLGEECGKKHKRVDEGEYQTFFQSALKKFGVSSPDEFDSEEKKKKFFNYVDKNYKAKKETD